MILSSPTCLLLAIRLAAPVETVAVEVDASSVAEYGKGITYQLGRKVSAALAEQGVVVDEASKNHLRIEVREIQSLSYDVTFVLEVDGKVVEPGLEHVTCEGCRIVTMDERVLAKLPEALALMDQANEPEPAVAEPVPEETEAGEAAEEPGAGEETSQPAQDGPKPSSKKGRALGPVGFAGIAVAGAGLGGVIGGAVLLGKGAERSQTLEESLGVQEDFGPQGRLWLGAGLVAVVVGGTLLALDLAVLRHKRTAVAMHPVVSPVYGGMALEARF